MFISPAFAGSTAAPAASGMAGGMGNLYSMLPIFLILLVFYFMVIRPQNTRIRKHREMVDALKKGDKVVTGGGIVATVTKAQEKSEEITLKISDGVEVSVLRATIISLRNPEEKEEKEKKK